MNLFSMEHENKYGMLMSDLINIFIPPENATQQELDEAKQNMVKYADYRTYLSFEMEQIVEGDERLVIGLSKMIKKNSGGEGQNPLYIALLASFAQAYHINLSARLTRRPTIRLVVLDEAFSKMDAEKVASCIELIRGLGFQAIISATNDKIQNYIENVDKTFVYANPNKKSISIQEFEKRIFHSWLWRRSKTMQTSAELKNLLQRIDHKGYPAYKDTRGSYEFPGYVLSIDHVQGDPFAAPSKVKYPCPRETGGIPGTSLSERLQKDRRAGLSAAPVCAPGRESFL